MVKHLNMRWLPVFISGMLGLCIFESWAQEDVRMKVRSEGVRKSVLAVSPFRANRETDISDRMRRRRTRRYHRRIRTPQLIIDRYIRIPRIHHQLWNAEG